MYAIASHDVCIGSIEFCPGEDIRVRTAKIGYWVSREYWLGGGIMTEVVGNFGGWVGGVFQGFSEVRED
jgi:RimJ/RimL family protein N-acetyltransferase